MCPAEEDHVRVMSSETLCPIMMDQYQRKRTHGKTDGGKVLILEYLSLLVEVRKKRGAIGRVPMMCHGSSKTRYVEGSDISPPSVYTG